MAEQANLWLMGHQFATFLFTFVTQAVSTYPTPAAVGIDRFKSVCLHFYMSL